MLKVGITTPGSLDPGNDYEPSGDLVLRTMCDPLIAADPRTGRLRPALAQSWVVSDHGQRLVIRLRKGATFSDGSPVTADDVVFSLSRIALADYASAAASRLEPILGFAQAHGDVEAKKDIDREKLAGVSALDRQSVEITLSSQKADFIRLLTSPLVSPVPRSRASSAAFARRPVCSGPYALTADYRSGDRVIRLARVAGHQGVDSTLTRSGAGYPDSIEFHVFGTTALAAAAQRNGQVDVAPAQPRDSRAVRSGPGPLVEFVGFPTATGPVFDKPQVRRALALALDREALVRQVFPGTRTPATGFLPPTALPAYKQAACPQLRPRGDLVAAQQLLRREGADLRGMRTRLYVNDDGRNVRLAQEVAAQWQRGLGLTTTLVVSDFDGYVKRGASPKGFDGPFRFSWSTPFADPDDFLFPLFSSERIGRDNFSRFSDPAVDRALARQAREAEQEEDRTVEYRRVEQLLCTQLPMVPLTFSLSRWLVSERLATASSYLDGTTGQPLLRELYVR